MRTRPIPRSGELLPVIGLGTWQTFDTRELVPLKEVVTGFFDAGCRVIDSSPMYGRSEETTGKLVSQPHAFLASKVWIEGKAEGEAQMRRSMKLMGREHGFDLMQVHNLVDVDVHLETLRAWKADGVFRYLGITHYQPSAFDELERLMKTESLDFVQLPYSLSAREAEARLLPCAKDTRTAVLVMQPFAEGRLLAPMRGREIPDWASARGFESWAELFLAFILRREEVTCVIAATAKVSHLREFVRAGKGPELDDEGEQLLINVL
ncbi:MAG: aldo/keto reductase [Archangium gephyra]|uniref:Aldo/keto reductase n=1 Tax=Archangium gephyra TaxID=48 RepID=A0A2W5T6W5_9BACT|nr:MAG: aldo/keto reductase [Archangium gephyra]